MVSTVRTSDAGDGKVDAIRGHGAGELVVVPVLLYIEVRNFREAESDLQG